MKKPEKDFLDGLPMEVRIALKLLPSQWKPAVDIALSLIVAFNQINEGDKQILTAEMHEALSRAVPNFSKESLDNPKVIQALKVLDKMLTPEQGESK